MTPRPPLIAALLASSLLARPASGFCGFYVAKADAKLFNRASQVALVRSGSRTVVTMANDYTGDPSEFALVIPVPTLPRRDQVRVVGKAVLEHLDAYTAPRLVEYHDPDPCPPPPPVYALQATSSYAYLADSGPAAPALTDARARSLGVTIEARFDSGEYEITILGARESDGLETWLRENGYRIPPKASGVLASYIRQKTKFFLAKVNLGEQARLGLTRLRPLQVEFESPRFMLPIRLGTVNAAGPQDLVLYVLTPNGRVETTNYRTMKVPTGVELPPYVKESFPQVYKALFAEQVRKEDMSVVFTEYAWGMSWACDPCVAEPLALDELEALGVTGGTPWRTGGLLGLTGRAPTSAGLSPRTVASTPSVFLTRLHVRYDAAHFPEDLVFQETADTATFQARYVLRHPWTGSLACKVGKTYRKSLRKRQKSEAVSLARLTGWPLSEVEARVVRTSSPDAGALKKPGQS